MGLIERLFIGGTADGQWINVDPNREAYTVYRLQEKRGPPGPNPFGPSNENIPLDRYELKWFVVTGTTQKVGIFALVGMDPDLLRQKVKALR